MRCITASGSSSTFVGTVGIGGGIEKLPGGTGPTSPPRLPEINCSCTVTG